MHKYPYPMVVHRKPLQLHEIHTSKNRKYIFRDEWARKVQFGSKDQIELDASIEGIEIKQVTLIESKDPIAVTVAHLLQRYDDKLRLSTQRKKIRIVDGF